MGSGEWARLELHGREMFVVFEKKVKMERLGTQSLIWFSERLEQATEWNSKE